MKGTTEINKELKKKERITNLTKEVFEIIKKELKEGSPVIIKNFGTFEARKKKEVTRKNPFTGEIMTIPEKMKIYFKPSKNFFEDEVQDIFVKENIQ